MQLMSEMHSNLSAAQNKVLTIEIDLRVELPEELEYEKI